MMSLEPEPEKVEWEHDRAELTTPSSEARSSRRLKELRRRQRARRHPYRPYQAFEERHRSGLRFGKLCSTKLLCVFFSVVIGLGCSAVALSSYGSAGVSELLDAVSVPDAVAIPVSNRTGAQHGSQHALTLRRACARVSRRFSTSPTPRQRTSSAPLPTAI